MAMEKKALNAPQLSFNFNYIMNVDKMTGV